MGPELLASVPLDVPIFLHRSSASHPMLPSFLIHTQALHLPQSLCLLNPHSCVWSLSCIFYRPSNFIYKILEIRVFTLVYDHYCLLHKFLYLVVWSSLAWPGGLLEIHNPSRAQTWWMWSSIWTKSQGALPVHWCMRNILFKDIMLKVWVISRP